MQRSPALFGGCFVVVKGKMAESLPPKPGEAVLETKVASWPAEVFHRSPLHLQEKHTKTTPSPHRGWKTDELTFTREDKTKQKNSKPHPFFRPRQYLRGALIVIHGRSRTTKNPRIPAMPGRSTSDIRQPGRHCLHQARSAVRGGYTNSKQKKKPGTWYQEYTKEFHNFLIISLGVLPLFSFPTVYSGAHRWRTGLGKGSWNGGRTCTDGRYIRRNILYEILPTNSGAVRDHSIVHAREQGSLLAYV